MSQITGQEKPAPQTLGGNGKPRYTGPDALEMDWFATHPRPVEEKTDATSDSGDDVPQA
jgi:hypothetical protein